MKILIVGWFAELVDLIIHLQEEGHDVYYYVETEADKEIGKGLIHLIKGWKSHAEDADLIIFPDVYFRNLPVQWREKGKAVIGGSALTDRLENDREFAAQIWKKFGFRVPETHKFSSFQEAIEFVKKNPKRYVFKPQGQKPRVYTYIAENDEDMIVALKHFQEVWDSKPEFVLQEYIDGIEMACTFFFNGDRPVRPYILNWEEKHIGNGNRGPLSGECGTTLYPTMKKTRLVQETLKITPFLKLADYRGFFDVNCYDSETEVLTRNGWKKFADITFDDQIMTLNPNTFEIEYQRPTAIISYPYKGKMYLYEGRLNFCVTPNHNMFLTSWYSYKKNKSNKPFALHSIDNIWHTSVVPHKAKWKGDDIEIVYFPPNWTIVSKKETKFIAKVNNEIRFKMEDFCEFLGWFISEGNLASNYTICITQKKDASKRQKIRSLLERMGIKFHYSPHSGQFIFKKQQLWEYLQPLGKCYEKYIPEEIKNLSPKYLRNLFFALMEGDGYRRKVGWTYGTSSKRLADDIQEIAVKLGYRVTINVQDQRGRKSFIGGKYPHTVTTRHKYYVLVISPQPTNVILKSNLRTIDYDGMVYCVEVPNHVIYVRRKGKPMWCGNCIVNKDGAYVLEATCFTESAKIKTRNGWKRWEELQVGEDVASLNLDTGELEWHPVQHILAFEHDGPVLHIDNKHEFAVTLDHDLLLRSEIDGSYQKRKAGEIIKYTQVNAYLASEFIWNGIDNPIITIPPIFEVEGKVVNDFPQVTVDTKLFFYFLGTFVGDGFHDGNRVYIIRQFNEERRKKIFNRLQQLPWPVKEINTNIVILSPQLAHFLESLGYEKNKREGHIFPYIFLEYAPKYLAELINGLTDTDGEYNRGSGRRIRTGNYELAEQIEDIAYKCGYHASINWDTTRWRVTIINRQSGASLRGHIHEEYYKGIVWCPVVPPHHLVMIKDRGKPFWCYQCRPGIPTIQIIDGLMEEEWGDFLYRLARGETDLMDLRMEWCVGVVMVGPPWPYEIKSKKYSDFPLSFPWKLVEQKKIHPGDIKAKEIDGKVLLTTAGNIGFTLVATGTGKSIDEAQKEVYEKVLPKVKYSLGWYRTDIGDRVKDKLDVLKKWKYL